MNKTLKKVFSLGFAFALAVGVGALASHRKEMKLAAAANGISQGATVYIRNDGGQTGGWLADGAKLRLNVKDTNDGWHNSLLTEAVPIVNSDSYIFKFTLPNDWNIPQTMQILRYDSEDKTQWNYSNSINVTSASNNLFSLNSTVGNDSGFGASGASINHLTLGSSEHGSVTLKVSGSETPAVGYVYSDHWFDLTATPDEGYYFSKWQVNGTDFESGGTDNPCRLQGTKGDCEFTAVFVPIQTYVVNFMDNDGSTILDTKTVRTGEAATTTATPSPKASVGVINYNFDDKWTLTNGGSDYADLSHVTENMVVYPHYSESYTSGRCIVGLNGDWTTAGAVHMHWDDDNKQDYYQIELHYEDEFKIGWVESDGTINSLVGYSSLNDSGEKFCFSSGDSDNFKCYAGGTYNIYFKENVTYIVKEGTVYNAEQVAAKLMSYGESPEQGKCGEKFPAIKSMYLGMTNDEKAKFQGFVSSDVSQFKNAYDRYVAWAKATGEKPWEEGKIDPTSLLKNITSENSSNIITIVIVCSLVAAAAGTYLILRKKKYEL